MISLRVLIIIAHSLNQKETSFIILISIAKILSHKLVKLRIIWIDRKSLVKKPAAAYVEKVYPDGDFGTLGI